MQLILLAVCCDRQVDADFINAKFETLPFSSFCIIKAAKPGVVLTKLSRTIPNANYPLSRYRVTTDYARAV